ncbi:sodium:proton antiporter : Sodium/hydrogen exchanger OS=Cyanothece sp. (strain PCC 8801) GN=PCC8801_1707 PE=4 SV=1: Na_H_Exchanger [Gemmata massiliana]|uniref:Cation/H+ exchanger transmembrane domain-containing protein n=1 Tax=Gemmata massiliana TaxID=1210884 RepID=A0A6P2D712_9BACT|nr:cation:proton antiporter [Gemmata massiliana]VTR97101.1 sodium:proton antiporter : Sodium/hydrogen exchanger OS=Cyanothece sp. (strain PCC 8801) GN=PCC8801_1707 PE=4 SV=1: Na_H_Exchanger [Gemmata massiliana]
MFDPILDQVRHLPPLVRFCIMMLIFFTVPPLCRRVRLPAVVGLLGAGLVIGPFCLGVAPKHGEAVEFIAELGKLLLMFFAGLEIDLIQFNASRNRSVGFGLLTFGVPLAAGMGVGFAAGYPLIGALLIGSLLASHTLIAYPIVDKLGKLGNEAVTVAIGATVFTDVAALLVLAVCIPIHASGFSPNQFVIQLLELAVYVPAVLLGLGWVSRKLFALKPAKEGQFALLLLVVALAAVAAEAINLEGIIGAFLAGLAVNSATRDCEAKHELEFLGNHLFIPTFFLTIGFLIDVNTFARTLVEHFWLVAGIVGGLIGSKFLAAEVARRMYGYTWHEGLTMWSLSLPQVAATLAAALVAYNTKNAADERLIGEPVLNSVIVLLVVTSVLGPILTERYAKQLPDAPISQLAPAQPVAIPVDEHHALV